MNSTSADRRAMKIGIVGFGRMAELCHLPGLRGAGWEVAAVLDVTPARREAAKTLGVPHVAADLGEFAACSLDAALVAPHSSVRWSVIEPLIARGIHLLIEKPLATTADEARRICEASERAGVLCSVFHNRRWDADFLRVKTIVESGFIGKVLRVENRLFEAEPATRFGAAEFNQSWRVTAALGGGSMLDWGPHLLDQVLTLMSDAGPVVSVNAEVRRVRHGDADDHFMIDLRFGNGAAALVGKSDICPIGPRHKWLVIGERGSLVDDWKSLMARNIEGVERRSRAAPRAADLHRNFLEAVRDGKPLHVTARQSLRTVEIFNAARRSAVDGASIAMRL